MSSPGSWMRRPGAGRRWKKARGAERGRGLGTATRGHAKEACERGHASVAAVLWRELRFDDGDARTRGAAARSSGCASREMCGRLTSGRARVPYVSWVFGEVAPSLAGGALGRLAAWAATRARALEADGRLDDALLIARGPRQHRRPLRRGRRGCGNDGGDGCR